MAEGTYEYECMRAELLGIEKPNYDIFMENLRKTEQKEVLEEEVDVENLKKINLEHEGLTKTSGKLDEVNNILKKTQSKINQMKISCGSVAGLLKNRLGSFTSQSSLDVEQVENKETPNPQETTNPCNDTSETSTPSKIVTSMRKSDLQKGLDKDLSALDAMIEKAEHAQYSMSHQTKQMKSFIK
ncbi:uncharacterized protein LOC130902051 [Diorhabda carinulata]|uniref:uncharacterized protein LOC130902051 n=1 Tax=Diorhabda carinulata TaxID=1163345 RepID=UPI0025A217DA|nr:uncharacterized protein LOC130902051 [Diorhabda carinulata]